MVAGLFLVDQRSIFSFFFLCNLLYNLYDFQLIIYIYIMTKYLHEICSMHEGLIYKEYIIFIYIICKETAFNKLLLLLNHYFIS